MTGDFTPRTYLYLASRRWSLMPDTSRNYRNQQNNPYVLDGLAATLHRAAAEVAWRWRSELKSPPRSLPPPGGSPGC